MRITVLLAACSLVAACAAPEPSRPPEPNGARSSSSVAAVAPSSAVAAEPPRGRAALAVPFAPQAPHAVWDPLHEEACEEMSLIMVHHYLEGTPLTRDDAEGELLALIAWQTSRGMPYDIDTAMLASVAADYYGHHAEVRTGEDVTADAIRTALDAGTPVIVPAQGQMLGNPYFSGEGPPYHMLVVTGYDGDEFITNDPGTRRGEGYRYDADVLMNAIHDWSGDKETVADAPRAMLLVTR